MGIIYTLIVGFIVGLLARAIKPGADAMGWIVTIILGIAGSFIGGLLAGAIGLGATGSFGSLVISVIGAIILLFVYEFATGKRRLK